MERATCCKYQPHSFEVLLLNDLLELVPDKIYERRFAQRMAAPMVPPPGGDYNRGPAILASTWPLTGLAIVAVGGRLYGRIRLTRNAGLDDFFISLSMVNRPALYSVIRRWLTGVRGIDI